MNMETIETLRLFLGLILSAFRQRRTVPRQGHIFEQRETAWYMLDFHQGPVVRKPVNLIQN